MGVSAMARGSSLRVMVGGVIVWICDLLMQTILSEFLEEWKQFFGRGLLFFIVALAGIVLIYHQYFHSHGEEVNDNEESDEVIENEHNENTSRRKSLSVVRSSLATLSLPPNNTLDKGEEVSPSWAEHNFHTPQP